MIDGTRNRAWLFWGGLGLSLVIHVGLAAHLLSRAAQDFGVTDLPTTAISVNIESSDILESVEEGQANQSAPSSPWTAGEPIPPQEAEPEKAEAPTPTEPEKAETSPPTETAEDQSAKAAARRSELAAQLEQQRIGEGALRRAAEAEREKQAAEQRARDKARQLAEEEEAREAKARKAQSERRATEKQKKAEKEARKKSGEKLSSSGASGSVGAQASAGCGPAGKSNLGTYARILNAWIARNKPPYRGRGKLVVLLAISPSGTLIDAHIIASSGNQILDASALASVRGATPFPQPPTGSTAKQLRFCIPFSFS